MRNLAAVYTRTVSLCSNMLAGGTNVAEEQADLMFSAEIWRCIQFVVPKRRYWPPKRYGVNAEQHST
jgi:hypothetical protein